MGRLCRASLADAIAAAAQQAVTCLSHASPCSSQEVLRGYVGDRSAKPVFAQDSNLFDGEALAQLVHWCSAGSSNLAGV